MIQKVNLCKQEYCSTYGETVIKFGKNLGFTVSPYDEDNKRFSIKNIKGDFEITKITQRDFGKQTNGGFEMNVPSIKDVDFDLLFRFDPNVYEPTLVIEPESSQIQSLDESKSPESVIPSYLSKLNENSKLYKIASNHKYADVIFITSDDTKIPSHRCILVNYSNIFGQIFEETAETPVEINVNDSTADTIQYALDFVNGKPDSIIGKEMEVFKFAVNYGIKDLIETCCSFFEESVVPENVCEYIVIAYDNNFEELKQKCLKMLVEKKKEIDALKIVKLPKNIFIDAFFL
uniref:BTB domain-containing protein n=1 Tax=Panagrolaimus sp. ES5 TaxID=591445 RepID=A0AC34FA85_9BILA